jgi:hypothetical protein
MTQMLSAAAADGGAYSGGGGYGAMAYGHSADAHRADAYAKAQAVDALLTQTSDTLRQLISRVNAEYERQQGDAVREGLGRCRSPRWRRRSRACSTAHGSERQLRAACPHVRAAPCAHWDKDTWVLTSALPPGLLFRLPCRDPFPLLVRSWSRFGRSWTHKCRHCNGRIGRLASLPWWPQSWPG